MLYGIDGETGAILVEATGPWDSPVDNPIAVKGHIPRRRWSPLLVVSAMWSSADHPSLACALDHVSRASRAAMTRTAGHATSWSLLTFTAAGLFASTQRIRS